MNILFVGKTDFKYNRVQVLIEGLKKIEGVHLSFYRITSHRKFDRKAFLDLEAQADFIYIPPFRHRDVSFIKKRSTKPVVFDPLISKYLTKDDFGHFWKLPFKYFLDKIPFSRCDILLSDTACHKEYFSNQFNIPPEKIHVLPIGVSTDSFFKSSLPKRDDGIFRVGFYGSFVPLQGTDKIMETAYVLRDHSDIYFEIIGGGYRFKQALKLVSKWKLSNVHFLGVQKYDELNALLNQFDLCLGIFGDSKKADSVIPNKIYHYASVGKCILTKDSDGIKELFTDNIDIVLTTTKPEDMAKAILRLKADRKRIEAIGEKAFQLVTQQYNEVEIAKKFLAILSSYSAPVHH
jgi:glycosyltransferase involved in cell wall biosynthesis